MKNFNGFTIHSFEICGSTNDEALLCTEDKSVFTAKQQTKGKGRRGRKWLGEQGNFYTTVLYLLDNTENIGCYSLAAAVSIGEALNILSPSSDISYKWPNDVLLSDKKVCGILLEIAENPLRLAIGTGVNITNYPSGLLNYEATSLYEQGIKTVNRDNLLETYLELLDFYIKLIKSGETEKIINKWLAKCAHLNSPIKVMLAKHMLFGLFKGLDKNGNLIISTSGEVNSENLIIPAGEILF